MFYLTAVSHHAQYLIQNLHVNTSSAACPLHGNPWKLAQQLTEFGSGQNSTLRLAPGSQILLTLQVEGSIAQVEGQPKENSSSLSAVDPFKAAACLGLREGIPPVDIQFSNRQPDHHHVLQHNLSHPSEFNWCLQLSGWPLTGAVSRTPSGVKNRLLLEVHTKDQGICDCRTKI